MRRTIIKNANIINDTKNHRINAIVIGGSMSTIARAIIMFDAKKPGQIANKLQAIFLGSTLDKI